MNLRLNRQIWKVAQTKKQTSPYFIWYRSGVENVYTASIPAVSGP